MNAWQWTYSIIEAILGCIQYFFLGYVLLQTYGAKDGIPCPRLLFSVCMIILGLLSNLTFHKSKGYISYFLISAFLLCGFSLFLKGWTGIKISLCLFLLVFKSLLVPLGDTLALKLVPNTVQPLNGFPYLISTFFSTVFLIPICMFLLKFKIQLKKKSSSPLAVLVLVISILITFSQFLLVKTIPAAVSNFWYNFCLLLVVSACYYMIYQLVQSFYKEINYLMEIEQLKYEKKYEEEIQLIYNSLKKLRHDFKNHILCMELLLKQNEFHELETYFRELAQNVYTADQAIDTGNITANVILNQKHLHALSLNIPVDIRASLPEQLQMKKMDLCAVLSNLFDNALEASEKATAPHISIEIKPVKNYLYFLFVNTVDFNFQDERKRFITHKDNPSEHGYGLQIVEEISRRYNGSMDISAKDGKFIVKVLLKV